nr:HAD-IA family hydrolase [Lachnospiraceae bacterium]
ETILEKYNLKPEECVFLDDNENNIRGAKECGLNTVHVKDHEYAVEELKKLLEKTE